MLISVHYFAEGETEIELINFLKKTGKIRSGKKAIKINLWQDSIKGKRKIGIKDFIFFVVDSDKTKHTDIFLENIKYLQSNKTKFCLIVQDKNLEDELCLACGKKNNTVLFKDFYNTRSSDEFKNRFSNDKDIGFKLNKNNFNFDKLWVNESCFYNFLKLNHLEKNLASCQKKSKFRKKS